MLMEEGGGSEGGLEAGDTESERASGLLMLPPTTGGGGELSLNAERSAGLVTGFGGRELIIVEPFIEPAAGGGNVLFCPLTSLYIFTNTMAPGCKSSVKPCTGVLNDL